MEYEKMRKIIHMFGFISLAYYLIPVSDYYRNVLAIMVVIIVMLFEFMRIVLGFDIPLFRHYEKNNLSGFGWCAIGLLTAFLIFPIWVNVPVVFAWAFVDPFMGYFRKKSWMLPAAFSVYLAIFYFTYYVVFGAPSWEITLAGPVVSFMGLWSELLGKKKGFRWLNDDFTMVLFPGFVYFILVTVLVAI